MKIDQYNSQKITIINFILIVMVVYIHGYYIEAESFFISGRLQEFWKNIFRVAIPTFYTISGFLYFKNCSSIIDILPKIKNRMHTLLVPYILWNVMFVLWYLVLFLLPSVSGFVNSNVIDRLNLHHPIDTFVLLFIEPAGFHLWFIRDLILFVWLSPILFLLIKRLKWWSLFIVLILTGWTIRLSMSAFVFGGIMAIHYPTGINIFRNRFRYFALICCCIHFVVAIILTANFITIKQEWIINYLNHSYAIIPVVGIWGLYDVVANESFVMSNKRKQLLSYTFFIYLFHEPTFNIIKKLGLKVLGVNDYSLSFLYLINPIIMCAVAICVAKLAQRYIPRVYSVLVGGRS